MAALDGGHLPLAASGMFTVILTSSDPACASLDGIAAPLVSTSGVSVLVIDCTAIGAPPANLKPGPDFHANRFCGA